MKVRAMSGQRFGSEVRRVYHHPAHLGDRVRCPHCGGFGPSNGSPTVGDVMVQKRRCRDCGQTYTTTIILDEQSNQLDAPPPP